MHGVKRLFAWMIPRFDPARFDVSLVSLRKKDLSEETLDALGIDITYLHKSKFDPSTLPALLKIIDRKKIDVLHLHGYGATTFGRVAAGDARDPGHPPRARESDRHPLVSENRRSTARTVHGHRHRRLQEHGRLRHQRAARARAEGEGGLSRVRHTTNSAGRVPTKRSRSRAGSSG